jgi:hypothetical protein
MPVSPSSVVSLSFSEMVEFQFLEALRPELQLVPELLRGWDHDSRRAAGRRHCLFIAGAVAL